MAIDAILARNAGSATLKFALYRSTGDAPPSCLTRGQVDLVAASHDDVSLAPLHQAQGLASDAPDARSAVDLFVYRIVVETGATIAALGGLDGLVFTVGIGTHQPVIRQRVCDEPGWLGSECDDARNTAGETRFDNGRSRVTLWNIPTDEEFVIGQDTLHALRAQRPAT